MKIDGRTLNAGQPKKPAKEKKQPVTIYETGEDIVTLGGSDETRRLMKQCFKLAVAAKSMGLNVLDIRIKI